MGNIEQLVESLSKAAAVKPAPHPFVLSTKWMAFAAAYLILALAFSGFRSDLLRSFHEPWFIVEIVVLLGMLITTALSTAVLAFPDLYQKRRVALAPLWAFALFLVVMFFAWYADKPPAPLPVHSYECTLCIVSLALLPSVVIFSMMRKFASTHYSSGGISAVLFAFSIGALYLRLHELNDSVIHVIEWHYLPMVGFGAAGWWLGKVLLKW